MKSLAARLSNSALNVDPQRLKTAQKLVLLAGLIFAAICFAVTVKDNFEYGGVDLRPKVVGARALLQGLDPYKFEWRPELGQRLLDPNRGAESDHSRSTYTPPTLLGYGLLSWLPYDIQRRLWFVFEWAALILSVHLLQVHVVPRRSRWLFMCIALFFFAGSYFWRLHVERGQFYVFELLLLAAASALIVRHSDQWLAGALIGAAAIMRPNIIVVLPALWLSGLKRTASGMTTSAVLIFLATLPVVGPQYWRSYFEAVGYWEQRALAQTHTDPEPATGQIVEDVELVRRLPSRSTNVTIIVLYKTFVPDIIQAQVRLDAVPVIAKIAAIGFVLLAGVGIPLLGGLSRPRRFKLGYAVLCFLTIEYLLPIRVSYADVVFLLPVALILPLMRDQGCAMICKALVLSGLVLGCGTIVLLPGPFETTARGLLVIGTLLVFVEYYACRRILEIRARRSAPVGVNNASGSSSKIT